ncbi:MAG TPA: exodeoxyribonuclease VII small subunit [Anaeromyxobacteraceae bacterium]|jgi:exodeoxyribonuclease VII small subunit|nr:exodeoxyribonuclease VII small subunit [Anaeromyxobacteraceae bacterium]
MAVSREKKTAEPAAEPYDQLVERLEKLVAELEGGKLPLEKSLETFAEGVKLAREAGRKLDEAERRVEELLRAEDGSVTSRPLGEEG